MNLNYRKNDVKLVKELIKKGADVNLVARGYQNQYGNNENSVLPIFYAANNSSVEIVKLLIEAGMWYNVEVGVVCLFMAYEFRYFIWT